MHNQKKPANPETLETMLCRITGARISNEDVLKKVRPQLSAEQLADLERVPSIHEWPCLSPYEQERRKFILAEIRQRIQECGPHRARIDPQRGRLFMPFAALKGYNELVENEESRIMHNEEHNRKDPLTYDAST